MSRGAQPLAIRTHRQWRPISEMQQPMRETARRRQHGGLVGIPDHWLVRLGRRIPSTRLGVAIAVLAGVVFVLQAARWEL